ncbi:MAG: GMC family oxidoreductase [Desulfobacterales bacterium]|jgi:choline dehydrogenase-like flavoprotein
METQNYDIIIIGAGAGGGALASHFAPSGKKILILERGTWLPREKRNWDVNAVMVNPVYENAGQWLNKNDDLYHTSAHYNVGGNSKFWGAALFRLREKDFEEVRHPDGISPAWPLKYADFEPYYTKVEKLFQVHGLRGEDPTAPPMSEDYPFPPISHEPRIQEIADALSNAGYHPFHLPTAIRLNELEPHNSECIRCNTCDGFPCLLGAKADGELNGIRPALEHPNVKLITGAYVSRLLTSASGREISGVEATVEGKPYTFKSDIVVVSCGATNSAALLLRSANDKHPRGLANSSDQVGRNYMYHLLGFMVAVAKRPNPTTFEKTLGMNDFYWGEKDYPYPMGNIQTTGKVMPEMLAAALKEPMKGQSFDEMAAYSTDWWFMTEDLPDPNNRISWEKDTVKISYTENNRTSFDRFKARWAEILKNIGACEHIALDIKIDINNVAHQCGTCRFGTDPKTSVLDLNCRTHDVDNLYVVDSSFYPSSAALNPTLTLLANALRVGDHLLERM